MSLADGTFRPSALCRLYDDGARFGCALADPSYHEKPSTAAPLDIDRFRRALSTSLFFIGDSITEQHFRAAACTLRAWNATRTTIPAARCYVHYNFDDAATVVDAGRGVARVCYVQAGKGRSDRSTHAAFEALASSGELVNGSTVVVNEGVWFRTEKEEGLPSQIGDAEEAEEVARAAAWGRVDFGLLSAQRVAVVWRETAAQHFATRRGSGMWPGRPGLTSERLPREACAPLREESHMGGAQRRRVAAVARALPPGMRVLPLFDASVAGWASHIERHTPHGRSTRGRDCSHFCEPSPLFEEANKRLLELRES